MAGGAAKKMKQRDHPAEECHDQREQRTGPDLQVSYRQSEIVLCQGVPVSHADQD